MARHGQFHTHRSPIRSLYVTMMMIKEYGRHSKFDMAKLWFRTAPSEAFMNEEGA